jgi:hypothetical protein
MKKQKFIGSGNSFDSDSDSDRVGVIIGYRRPSQVSNRRYGFFGIKIEIGIDDDDSNFDFDHELLISN